MCSFKVNPWLGSGFLKQCFRVYLKMSTAAPFGLVWLAEKLHMTTGIKHLDLNSLGGVWSEAAVWTFSRRSDSSSAWFLLPWCWRCLCWRLRQLSPTTITTWAGSTATARASTSSAPTERSLLQPGATTASRMDPTACGHLNASPRRRVWGSPLTVGGTTSTVLGWNGRCASKHCYWTGDNLIDRMQQFSFSSNFRRQRAV